MATTIDLGQVMSEDFTHGTEHVQVLGSQSGNIAFNTTNGNIATATKTASGTISLSGATNGKATTATLILTNGGAYTVSWDSNIKWAGGTMPTLTASGVDVLTFICVDGTTWYGAALSDVK